MIKAKFLRYILLSVISFLAFKSFGQDARVSQYNAIPLLVNPAQTGDFEGQLRALGLGVRVNSRTAHNYMYNASVDYNLGVRNDWGLGLNYMRSGADAFPISGHYFGASVARRFYLDKAGLQQLRIGAQASYLTGDVDANKTGYDRLLDVSAFRYLNRPLANPSNGNTASASYLNYSLGAKYKFEIARFKIETGFAAYNITNPNHNFSYQGTNTLLKRYRVTALTSLSYQFSHQDAFKVEHYSWKEGIFLRDYKPTRDTVGIHETTYSLTWLHRVRNNTFSVGVYSRSWQSVYGVVAVNLSDRIGLSASYETPILKPYYDIAHVELGLSFYPFRKKASTKNSAEQLTKQVTGLLPFGTTFCLPCEVKVAQAIPPVISETAPPKKAIDSLAADTVPKWPVLPLKSNIGSGLLYADTIYYNLDKYNIRPDAQVKLDQISRIMKRLDLSLDVRSHTDLRANAAYNKKLSERRADAVKNYLMGSGINPDKISTSWFGKNQPINNCITCIDSLQEKNRRSELVLKGFNDQNLQIMLDEKFFGDEVRTKAELEAKIKQTLALEGGIDSTLIGGSSGVVSDNRYYTVQVAAIKIENEETVLDLKWLNMFNEKGKDGYRRYFYGVFMNKDQADKALLKLKQLGLKDALIREVSLSLN